MKTLWLVSICHVFLVASFAQLPSNFAYKGRWYAHWNDSNLDMDGVVLDITKIGSTDTFDLTTNYLLPLSGFPYGFSIRRASVDTARSWFRVSASWLIDTTVGLRPAPTYFDFSPAQSRGGLYMWLYVPTGIYLAVNGDLTNTGSWRTYRFYFHRDHPPAE